MTPADERLERRIRDKCAAVSILYAKSVATEGSGCHAAAESYRAKARMAAADVGRLVARRSPAVVARLERERGLV